MALFKKLKMLFFRHPQNNYTYTDDDRERSLAIRRQKNELKKMDFELKKMDFEQEKLKKSLDLEKIRAELSQLKYDLNPDIDDEEYINDDESEGKMLLSIFKNVLEQKQAQSQTATSPAVIGDALPVSDESTPQFVNSADAAGLFKTFMAWADENKIPLNARLELKKRLGF